MRVRWSGPAIADLRGIQAYIARDNPAAASTVISRLRNVANLLAQYPHAGRPGKLAATREHVVARLPYIVIYRIDGDVVQIPRVLHGARDWPG